jgi:2-dehydropantoate 2-reductase
MQDDYRCACSLEQKEIRRHEPVPNMKICFAGAGALGCSIGGTLAAGGAEVWLVDRNEAHVHAMRSNGLRMRTEDSEKTVKVNASTRFEDVGPADLVIVLVKSAATENAVKAAKPIIGPETVVMSLQNGMGHEDILGNIVGRERVMAGKTYAGGVYLGPGHVIAGTRGKETVIGELDGRITPRARAVRAEFEKAGMLVELSDNIMGTIWDKLLINVSTGAVSAITRLEYGPLYAMPEIEETAVAAVAEAMSVAKASGVTISYTNPRDPWLKASAGLPYDFKTSMLQSLEKGSLTEVDFINGAVVRAGRKVGVPTPVNSTLVAMVKGIEHRMLNPTTTGKS